jgi:hypothetical protein
MHISKVLERGLNERALKYVLKGLFQDFKSS